MRITLTVAAPLALALAACGDSTPVDEATPEPIPEATVPVTLPSIPANSVVTIDYPGIYGQERGNRLELNEDNTYTFTNTDEETISGTYEALEESNRIRLNDFDGEDVYFSVGNGAIYRLADEDAAYDEITTEGEFLREVESVNAQAEPTGAAIGDVPTPGAAAGDALAEDVPTGDVAAQ